MWKSRTLYLRVASSCSGSPSLQAATAEERARRASISDCDDGATAAAVVAAAAVVDTAVVDAVASVASGATDVAAAASDVDIALGAVADEKVISAHPAASNALAG